MYLAFFFEKFCNRRRFFVEKFGIFELLDALSALTAREDTQGSTTPQTQDAAYQPPVYGKSEPPEPQSPTKQEPRSESDALAGFYARHNAIAKKATKK